MLFGIATVGKSPPLAWLNRWLNRWLAQYCPSQVSFRYVCIDCGGELDNNGDIHKLLAHQPYAILPTAPASSFQNAPGERPHQDIGASLQIMLRGANPENKFWPFAFNYALQISNVLTRGGRGVPLEGFTAQCGSVKKYRTFGCLVIVKTPDKRNRKLESNFHRGFFLGFTGTLLQIYYWDLVSQRFKRSYTIKFDECSTVMDRPSPNSLHLRDALDGKDMPIDDQEYIAPAAFDLASSSCPFIKLKVLEIQIRCDHEIFGIESADCADLTHAYISNMVPNSTGSGLGGWRRHYAGAYIVELNTHPVFNTADFHAACALFRASLQQHHTNTISLTYAPERKDPLREPWVFSSNPCRSIPSCHTGLV
jgi:hypothetical protein